MIPGHSTGLPCRARLAVALLAAFCCAQPPRLTAAPPSPPAPASGAAPAAFLEYRETPNGMLNATLPFTPQTSPFPKEPVLGGSQIHRGTLDFGAASGQAIPLIWDQGRRKLHLDLNRNRDLTDDPAGVFAARNRGAGDFFQAFTNVHLTLKFPEGPRPVMCDLSFYSYGNNLHLSAACRSFWEGRISLQGREWQVGFVPGIEARRGSATDDYLLLRPWAARNDPFDLQDGSLAGFRFSPNLFFGQQAYHLVPAWGQEGGQTRLKLEFQEQAVETADLKLTGRYISRLRLGPKTPSGYTVVLNSPAPLVKAPVGTYRSRQVALKQGRAEAWSDEGSASVTVAADKPALLACGGPLTNTVSADRSGRQLRLDYALVGAGGETYRLSRDDPSAAPRFDAYLGDKKLATHKFEFG
jgi:hypothetical protein